MRIAVFAIVAGFLWTTYALGAAPSEGMVQLKLGGRTIEGVPLVWNNSQVYLLGRSGRLWEFDPDEATDFRKTSTRFRSYSVSEFRAVLLREFGRGFEVSGTGHYLVAHPRGQRDKWAGRFEDLYRSFVHYFSVRGFRLQKPPFPLIGIVCRDRREFFGYAAERGLPVSPSMLGYYSLESNRIILYDIDDRRDLDDWHRTASIIIHEATHQTAFNTGVHSRYVPPPLWVAEGLATMFEAPGVYDSQHFTRRSDRINRARLRVFRKLVEPNHRPELLASLIATDDLFRTNPAAAYAEAWALSFYLVETQAPQYMRYLKRTARRPPFTQYTAAERTTDFTAVFGNDGRMLQARFLRFMAGLE